MPLTPKRRRARRLARPIGQCPGAYHRKPSHSQFSFSPRLVTRATKVWIVQVNRPFSSAASCRIGPPIRHSITSNESPVSSASSMHACSGGVRSGGMSSADAAPLASAVIDCLTAMEKPDAAVPSEHDCDSLAFCRGVPVRREVPGSLLALSHSSYRWGVALIYAIDVSFNKQSCWAPEPAK